MAVEEKDIETKRENIRGAMLKQRQVTRCAECGEPVLYHMNIAVKYLKKVDDIVERLLSKGRDFKEPSVVDEFFYSNVVECPCCDALLRLQLKLEVCGVVPVDPAEAPAVERELSAKRLSASEKVRHEEWLDEGLITAFHSALKQRGDGSSMPNRIDRYLVTFLRNAQPMRDAYKYAQHIGAHDHDFELNQFQGVVAIIIGGELRGFIPYKQLKESALGARPDYRRPRQITEASLELWIRTRNGYVLGRGLMFNELKGRAAGDFAKATGNY